MAEARGYLLVVAEPRPGAPVAFPRAVRLAVGPGEGRAALAAPARADAAWSAALARAWRHARDLAGAPRADATVEVAGAGLLAGGSSAHALGVLLLAALLDAPLPPHFAVGHVEGPRGFVTGGAAAAAKARAAADVARGLGWAAPVPFLVPPLAEVPAVPAPLVAVPSPDVATSLRALAPAAYARVAARHDALRAARAQLPADVAARVPAAGPFEVEAPSEDDGAPAGARDAVVGRDGIVLHRGRALTP